MDTRLVGGEVAQRLVVPQWDRIDGHRQDARVRCDIDGMVLSSSTIPFVGNIHHRFSICKAPASVKKRFRRAIVELMQGTSLPIM